MICRVGPIALAILMLLSGCATTGSGDIDSPAAVKSGTRMASAETYATLAAAYLKDGRIEVALSKAKQALAVDSDNAYANSVMGLVCQRMGHPNLAEKHLKRALDKEPNSPYYVNAYATLLCSLTRFDEAQKLFEKAAANPLNHSPAVALTNAGICSFRRPDLKQAETFFRRALEADPKFPAALLGMAHLSFDTGQFLAARAYVQRFEQATQATPESLLLGARTELKLGDAGAASLYEMKLKAKFPDAPEVQVLRDLKRP